MIVAENISKRYGAQVLFEGVSFRINPREKVGLVGRNGHGKTTLFRIIAGEEHPDDGKITAPKNYTLGYLHQHLNLSHDTVIAEASSALGHQRGGPHLGGGKDTLGPGIFNRRHGETPVGALGGLPGPPGPREGPPLGAQSPAPGRA